MISAGRKMRVRVGFLEEVAFVLRCERLRCQNKQKWRRRGRPEWPGYENMQPLSAFVTDSPSL